jgi:hypothetical protein
MTIEEQYAYMDEIFPRMSEPDEEGIDLHPEDHRRRFIAVAEGTIFTKASPITEEEKAEVEKMWQMMTDGNYTEDTKGTGKAKKDIKPRRK